MSSACLIIPDFTIDLEDLLFDPPINNPKRYALTSLEVDYLFEHDPFALGDIPAEEIMEVKVLDDFAESLGLAPADHPVDFNNDPRILLKTPRSVFQPQPCLCCFHTKGKPVCQGPNVTTLFPAQGGGGEMKAYG